MSKHPVLLSSPIQLERHPFALKQFDHIIFSETACYRVKWEVSGIEAVYLNDAGKIGEGEERLCYDEIASPELQVEFSDGTSQTYSLDIVLIQQEPGFWIVVGIALFLFTFGIYIFILPVIGMTIQSTRPMLYAIVNFIALILFIVVIVATILEIGLQFLLYKLWNRRRPHQLHLQQ